MGADQAAHAIRRNLNPKSTEGGMSNEKMNFRSKDLWSIVAIAASAALCAIIDILLKEDTDEDSET